MRGLFVEVKNDIIVPTDENSLEDISKVRGLLSSLNIPTVWGAEQNQNFQVLVNRLPVALMKKIMNIRG
jgi:hypothetical protein